MKPRKFTVSPKAVTASRDTVSSSTDDHITAATQDSYATASVMDLKDQAQMLSEQLVNFRARAMRAPDKDKYISKYDWHDLKNVIELMDDIVLGVILSQDVDSCDTITSGESIQDKNGLTAYLVTFGWDDGGPESGPIWGCGTDIVYAESEDDACAKWEAAHAGQFDIYEGCSAREATPEEVAYDNMVQEFDNWEDDLPFGEEN